MFLVAALSASHFGRPRYGTPVGEIRKPGAPQGQVGAVELQEETRLDNRFVFPLHHLRHGFQVGFSGRIIAVREKVGNGARQDCRS